MISCGGLIRTGDMFGTVQCSIFAGKTELVTCKLPACGHGFLDHLKYNTGMQSVLGRACCIRLLAMCLCFKSLQNSVGVDRLLSCLRLPLT
mmetsp:Transcript_139317/g.338439  ORF Transcript_139317/g.338439 Transcript_139317/m.338439 type:complete len:91 (+) Transcript_139317:561-833(+)